MVEHARVTGRPPIWQVLHGTTDDPSYVLSADPVTGRTLWRVERSTRAIRATAAMRLSL